MKTYRIICTKHGKNFQEFVIAVRTAKELDLQLFALLNAGFTSISYCKLA